MWWSEAKERFYIRAAERSSFHKELTGLLEINQKEKYADLGSGLGFLTNAIAQAGAEVTGYDNDPAAIDSARKRFPAVRFVQADCYALDKVADVSICCFFGHISEEGNLEKLLRSCTKRLIYITKSVDEYKLERVRNIGLRATTSSHTLYFNQPLESEEELRSYLEIWPKEEPEVIRTADREYPLLLKKEKKMTIFTIYKE